MLNDWINKHQISNDVRYSYNGNIEVGSGYIQVPVFWILHNLINFIKIERKEQVQHILAFSSARKAHVRCATTMPQGGAINGIVPPSHVVARPLYNHIRFYRYDMGHPPPPTMGPNGKTFVANQLCTSACQMHVKHLISLLSKVPST